MTNQQIIARHLYFEDHKTQKEIAAEVGVSERTIYNWIHFFSWHKLREAAITAPAVIADNISRQIIALQNQVFAREENHDAPTAVDISMQCRLISCLDKLKKYPTRGQSVQAVGSFIDFIGQQDDALSEKLWEFYNQFSRQKTQVYKPWNIESGHNPFIYAPPADESPAEEETGNQQPEAEPSNSEYIDNQYSIANTGNEDAFPEPGRNRRFRYLGTGNQPETEEPVVTEQDYREYKNILTLGSKGTFENAITKFRGKYVSSKWLEYNLFQYCLPPADRHFINDPQQVINMIDYKHLREKILLHISPGRRKAA